MNKKYDKNTYLLIKKMIAKQKKSFSPIDEKYLKLLINKEIDCNQIDNERKKCKEDLHYFINNYIYVRNKYTSDDKIPHYLKDRIEGDKIKFHMYDIQKKLVDNILEYDNILSVKSRQIGFTTTALAATLQLISFFNNKVVLLFSKSQRDAKKTLNELKFMYLNLPTFLKREELKNNENELALGSDVNKSEILVQTSGRASGRSNTATQIILDEADYIMGIENIYRAAQPAISSSKGKFIILSTPNLYDSQFHQMYKGSKNGTNNFVSIEGAWNSIPQRDKDQYEDQCKAFNYRKKDIMTELNMEQILPYDTYFEMDKIKSLNKNTNYDIICGNVLQYYKPEKEGIYIISVDSQEGGIDYNGINVISMYDNKIYANLKTRLDIFNTLIELSSLYNNAKIIIERNRGYYLIKKFQENDLSHLLLPNVKYIMKTDRLDFDIDEKGKPNKIGFFTSKHTRPKLLLYFSNQVYKSNEVPTNLFEEIKTFVTKRGRAEALEHDDLIMSLGIGLLLKHVILESKKNAAKNKNLKYLIENYQGDSLDKNKERIQHINKVKDQISNLTKSLFISSNISNFYTNIEDINEMYNTTSKMKNAFVALL